VIAMKKLRVRDLMSWDVVTVLPDVDTETAWDLMSERQLRHLVVVDPEGDLLGIVSHRDLLRHALIEQADVPRYVERELLAGTRVQEVMVEPVETVDPEQDIAEAARILFEGKIGCLPVVEGSSVVGILTESDFVRWFAYGPRAENEEPLSPGRAASLLASSEAWPTLAE
jgi:acetoin utilization protein AcuB